MLVKENLSFLECASPEDLSTEDREKYFNYWSVRTQRERVGEVWRLSMIRYKIRPDARIDKTHIRVIDMIDYGKSS